MKIAYLFQSGGIQFAEPGAAQLHILHTLRSLRRRGHQVALLANQRKQRVLLSEEFNELIPSTPDSYAELGLSGTTPFRRAESSIRRIQTAVGFPYMGLFDSFRMYDACQRNLAEFDILHERYNLLSIGGVLASIRLGVPFVLEVNADLLEQRRFKGTPERGLRRWYSSWTTRLCFRRATGIICISAGLRDHLAERWKVDERKLFVLPCAADITSFEGLPAAQDIRRDLGFGDEPVVMWVGGFYPWHDLETLTQSFSRVIQQVPSAKLVLIGDGETRSQVQEQTNSLGLNGSVVFTGNIPHREIPRWLSLADITVAPSAGIPESQGGTGTPLKIFEYMAAGKPTVATRSRQVREVMTHGEDGLLVDPGDADDMTAALVRLLKSPEERQNLGQVARKNAVQRHSWEKYGAELEAIYEKCVERGTTAVRGAA